MLTVHAGVSTHGRTPELPFNASRKDVPGAALRRPAAPYFLHARDVLVVCNPDRLARVPRSLKQAVCAGMHHA